MKDIVIGNWKLEIWGLETGNWKFEIWGWTIKWE